MYDGGRARGASGAKRLRLACIFIAVAAVTGFVIWKTIPPDSRKGAPSKVNTQPEVPVPEKGQGSAVDKTSSFPGMTGSSARGGDSSGGTGQSGSIAPAVLPEQPASAPAAKSPSGTDMTQQGRAADHQVVSDRKGSQQRAVYEKGKPGPRDPAPGNDKPLIPQEKSDPAAVSQKMKELSSAFTRKDYAFVSASAPDVLSSLTPGSEPYRAVLDLLTRANWARIISRDVSGGFAVRHTVGAGEYLGRIAKNNRTTVSLVMLVNKLKTSNIMVGQKLVLLPGPWKITVSKKRRQLELRRKDAIFMGFDVGIGRLGSTPSATFVVSDRLKHPVYRTADGRIFQHGDPGNELGDYFLKLAATGTPARPLLGYGIHGTADESSVMRSLSSGCVRMRNADVEKLYHIVPAGTPVETGE